MKPEPRRLVASAIDEEVRTLLAHQEEKATEILRQSAAA